MKTFKQLVETLKSGKERYHFFKSLGYNDDDAWGAADERDDRERALKKSLQDPTRSAEQHGQAVRILRRMGDKDFIRSSWNEDGRIEPISMTGDPQYTPKQMAAREASRRRRQPKPSYIKSKSPPLLTGRTINKQN